jgi:hypothetical protein
MRQFWMIFNEGNRGPAVQHYEESDARREAERLARNNRGQKFYVLKTVDCCRVNDIAWASENEIPF